MYGDSSISYVINNWITDVFHYVSVGAGPNKRYNVNPMISIFLDLKQVFFRFLQSSSLQTTSLEYQISVLQSCDSAIGGQVLISVLSYIQPNYIYRRFTFRHSISVVTNIKVSSYYTFRFDYAWSNWILHSELVKRLVEDDLLTKHSNDLYNIKRAQVWIL